ncbi:MAG: hypothetical protein AAF552_07635 [Pseudomonadota bacterium]
MIESKILQNVAERHQLPIMASPGIQWPIELAANGYRPVATSDRDN